MDQALVNWAVTAMDFGEDTVRAEQWFKLLTEAYQDPDEGEPVGGWDAFVARLNAASEREGFDSAQVQFFVESLGNAVSDPIGDVVLPMYEQRDSLPQEYVELRAAAAEQSADGAEAYDAAGAEGAESADQEWNWDDTQKIWNHLEDNEWVPQVQNGFALNYERTEWVALEPEALAEEPAAADEAVASDQEWQWDDEQRIWNHLENNEWVPQVQNGYALNYDRTEWVAVEPEAAPTEPAGVDESAAAEGAAPTEATPDEPAEPIEQPVFEALPEEEQLEALAEFDAVDEVLESVAPAIEDAVRATDGIELGDLTEEQVEQMLDRLLSATPSAAS
jgi:hypothetical protein